MIDKFCETEKLKYAWNRWSNAGLATYMRRSLFHPQHYFTQNILFEFLEEKNPGANFLFEERFFAFLIKIYFYKNTWLRDRKPFLGKILELFEEYASRVRRKRLKNLQIKKVSVLDIGCGSGNYYVNFKKRGLDHYINYCGVDIAEKNIENCKKFFPEARFLVGNIYSLDFNASSFDLVFVSHLFEHLAPENLPKAFQEATRIARLSLVINFFNERDISDHIIDKRQFYYWNCLSREKIKDFFVFLGDKVKIIDIYPGFFKKYEISGAYGPGSYSSWVIKLNKI